MKSKLLLTVLFLGTILFRNQAQELDLSNNIIGYQEPFTKILGQTAGDDGNIYYWGIFKGALVIDGEVKALGRGGEDFYVAVTDFNGNFLNAYTYGSEANEFSPSAGQNAKNSILVNGGFAYIVATGMSLGASFETANGVFKYNDIANRSVFLKINLATGDILFAKASSLLIVNIFKSRNEIFLQGDLLFTTAYTYAGISYNTEESIPRSASFFLKTNLEGERIWLKLIQSTSLVQSSVLRIDDVEFNENGEVVFAFNINGETFSINKNNFNYSISGQNRNLFIAKTNTDFENIQVKLLYRQPRSSNWIQGIDVGINASFILFYFRDGEMFSFDSANDFYQRNHVLLQVDQNFELKQINKISSFGNLSNSIRYTSLRADSNNIYLDGIILSSSTAPVTPPANVVSINVFKSDFVDFDLNGAPRRYLVKSDHTVTNYSVRFTNEILGNINSNITTYQVVSANKYFNFDKEDEVWNPWIFGSDLKTVKGRLVGSADGPDDAFSVNFLDNGSRIIMGFASGYTLLDSANDNSIIKNKIRKDLFVLQIDSQNQLVWYKRFRSSFKNTVIQSIKKIGNNLHVIANYNGTDNKFGDDYIEFDNESIPIPYSAGLKQPTVQFVISEQGVEELSLIPYADNLKMISPQFKRTIVDSNYYIELANINTKAVISVNGQSFSTVNGTYVSLIDRNDFSRKNAFKIYMADPTIALPSINTVQYSPEDQNLVLSLNGSFPQAGPNYVDIRLEFLAGVEKTFRIYKEPTITVPNWINTYTLVLKMNWTGVDWLRKLGPFVNSPRAKILPNGNILAYGAWRGESLFCSKVSSDNIDTSSIVLANSIVQTSITYYYALIFSKDGELLTKKIFSDTTFFDSGTTITNKLAMIDMKIIDTSIFLLGINSAAFQIDNVLVGEPKRGDAVAIQFDLGLKAKNVYRVASDYQERMLDCDIYQNKISFIYLSQGNPTLVQGNSSSASSLNSFLSQNKINFGLDNFSRSSNSIATTGFTLNNINPLDKEENAGQGQFGLCKELVWYKDEDGDGFGNKNIISLHCEKPIGYVSNALDCDDTEFASAPCPCPIRTFSNDWASNAISPLNDQWFSGKYPFGLTIGDATGKAFSVKFTSAVSVKKFISNSNQPYVLTRSYENPSSKDLRNNLANQVLFLEMNIRYNPGLRRSLVKSGSFFGQTVKQIFEEANLILSGQKLVNKSALGAICDVVEKINGSYESGKSSGFLNCTTSSFDGLTTSVHSSANTSEAIPQKGKQVLYAVYPNPSNTSFTYRSSATMIQEISIFNSVGQLMEKFVYRPQENLIFGSSYKSGIYYLRVSDKDSGDLLRVIKR